MEFPILRIRTESLQAFSRSRGAERNGFVPWDGFVPFEVSGAETDLGTCLREVASAHATSVAIVDESGRALTYAELLVQANRVAVVVRRWFGDHPDAPRIVAVSQGGVDGIVGLLGTLLAGGAYLAIDTAWPDAQIVSLLAESKAEVLLASAAIRNRLRSHADGYSGSLFDVRDLIVRESGVVDAPVIGAGEIAAIFATSGSTGGPKLVALSHRAILFDIGRQVNDLFLGPKDRFDLLFSMGFSASLAPIFGALLNGSQLHLFDVKRGLASLPEWLGERDISLTTMSVSTLRAVFLTPRRRFAGNALRMVSVGGEPLLSQDVQAFQQLFPEKTVLQNAMAATETRTYAQFFVVRGEKIGNVVPIGLPVSEKEVVLLNDGKVVAEGECGEIVIRSRYLCSGYLNDTALTRQKFEFLEDGLIQYKTGDLGRWNSDGSLLFLGRTDWQVKIRGHRVELLAVEAALRRCAGVVNCAVVAREDQPGEPRIVAYAVGLPGGTESVRKVRAFLTHELPDYMVPAVFVFLDALPLNRNGKVDRNLLPAPQREAEEEPADAVTCVETELRSIWSAVLKLEGFSRGATLAELGGDSLQLLQIQLRLRASFGSDAPAGRYIGSYLDATLAETAAAIELERRDGYSGSALTQYVDGGRRGVVIVIPGVVGNFLKVEEVAPYVDPGWSVYGLEILKITSKQSAHTLVEIAHVAWQQIRSVLVPGTPFVLMGYCLGAQVAFEIAREADAIGEGQPLVCTIDTATVNNLRTERESSWGLARNAVMNLPQWLVWNLEERDIERVVHGVRRILGSCRGAVPHQDVMGIRGPSDSDVASLPESVLAMMRTNFEAISSYLPGRYAGPIAVFRTWKRTLFASRDFTMGWGKVAAGEIGVRWLSGLHHTCMEGENLKANMVIINQRIQAFQRDELHRTSLRVDG